jgi:nucleotide-binding universal stress UspA family protein
MKILAAIDNSNCAEAVLNAISTQTQPKNTSVRIVHVLRPIGSSAPPQMASGFAPELQPFAKPACELVAKAQKKLLAAGFQAEATLEKGDVRESIIDTAAEWGADLIILGSHNHSTARRLVLGSIAEYVARYAACSVQIVRERKGH